MGIPSAGRHHLQLLRLADALARIEHTAARTRNIEEALQRRLPRIAAGRHENKDFPLFAILPRAERQQMRQELKRHILKRKRRTMPKLQRMRPSAHLSNRRNLPAVKASAVCAADRSGQFLPRKVGQKAFKHRQRALLIAHFAQRGNLCK